MSVVQCGEGAKNPPVRSVLNIIYETKMSTWNIQSMYPAGETADLIKEMKRLCLYGLAVCTETRWPDMLKCVAKPFKRTYSIANMNSQLNRRPEIIYLLKSKDCI